MWWLPDPAAEQDEAFRRIWQNLRQVPAVTDGRHDTEGWHQRTGTFVLCCARIPDGTLTAEYDEVHNALLELPYARLHPVWFLNIPVLELGYLVDEPLQRDEIDQTRLTEFIQMAERPVRDYPRFLVELGGVNSFADAAFIDIHDDGWFSRIHRRLLDFMVVPPDTTFPYLPLLTIAQYTTNSPIGRLPAMLAEWRDSDFGAFEVEAIEIVGIRTGEPYALPEVLHVLPLGTRNPSPVFTTLPS